MKRLTKCVVAALMCAVASCAYAKLPALSNRVFERGDHTLGLLVGYGDGFSQKLAFNHCVLDSWFGGRGSLGIGAAVGNCIDKHWDRLALEITASLHYQMSNSIDTYVSVGAGGGYKWYEQPYGNDKGFFSWSTNAGVRWYLSRAFALNIEAGYTFGSYILAGVCWRF